MLRGEWGYQGVVMTDWGANYNPVANRLLRQRHDRARGNPAQITVATTKTAPKLDVTGLPVVAETSIPAFQYHVYNVNIGGLALSPTGASTITTTVNARTDLSNVLSTITTLDAQFNPTTVRRGPYASVDAAYRDLVALLASDAFSAVQKAAVTVTPTYRTPGDSSSPVVAYTVKVRGDYATMRLGDLQRSVSRILNVASQSAPFAQLAEQQGVRGIRVGPWSPASTDPNAVPATGTGG